MDDDPSQEQMYDYSLRFVDDSLSSQQGLLPVDCNSPLESCATSLPDLFPALSDLGPRPVSCATTLPVSCPTTLPVSWPTTLPFSCPSPYLPQPCPAETSRLKRSREEDLLSEGESSEEEEEDEENVANLVKSVKSKPGRKAGIGNGGGPMKSKKKSTTVTQDNELELLKKPKKGMTEYMRFQKLAIFWERKFGEMRNKRDILKQKLAELREKYNGLSDIVQKQSPPPLDHEAQRKKLEIQVSSLKQACDKTQLELTAAREEVTILEEKLTELETEKATTDEKKAKANEACTKIEEEYQALKAEVARYIKERDHNKRGWDEAQLIAQETILKSTCSEETWSGKVKQLEADLQEQKEQLNESKKRNLDDVEIGNVCESLETILLRLFARQQSKYVMDVSSYTFLDHLSRLRTWLEQVEQEKDKECEPELEKESSQETDKEQNPIEDKQQHRQQEDEEEDDGNETQDDDDDETQTQDMSTTFVASDVTKLYAELLEEFRKLSNGIEDKKLKYEALYKEKLQLQAAMNDAIQSHEKEMQQCVEKCKRDLDQAREAHGTSFQEQEKLIQGLRNEVRTLQEQEHTSVVELEAREVALVQMLQAQNKAEARCKEACENVLKAQRAEEDQRALFQLANRQLLEKTALLEKQTQESKISDATLTQLGNIAAALFCACPDPITPIELQLRTLHEAVNARQLLLQKEREKNKEKVQFLEKSLGEMEDLSLRFQKQLETQTAHIKQIAKSALTSYDHKDPLGAIEKHFEKQSGLNDDKTAVVLKSLRECRTLVNVRVTRCSAFVYFPSSEPGEITTQKILDALKNPVNLKELKNTESLLRLYSVVQIGASEEPVEQTLQVVTFVSVLKSNHKLAWTLMKRMQSKKNLSDLQCLRTLYENAIKTLFALQ